MSSLSCRYIGYQSPVHYSLFISGWHHALFWFVLPLQLRESKRNGFESFLVVQLEACHALTNIAAGAPEQTCEVVNSQAIPALVQLLASQKEELRDQVPISSSLPPQLPSELPLPGLCLDIVFGPQADALPCLEGIRFSGRVVLSSYSPVFFCRHRGLWETLQGTRQQAGTWFSRLGPCLCCCLSWILSRCPVCPLFAMAFGQSPISAEAQIQPLCPALTRYERVPGL